MSDADGGILGGGHGGSRLLSEWKLKGHRREGDMNDEAELRAAVESFAEQLSVGALSNRLFDRMAAMLRRLEWWGGACPMCCVERYTGRDPGNDSLIPLEPPGHLPACDLAALLREIP